MNGIIPLYKPKGMTSHDCVFKMRKMLHIKKIGHTGTLDPDVEGVLPICVGDATKIIPFLIHLNKEYIANVQLGVATTTEDSSGEVILQKAVTNMPTTEEINDVLQTFIGTIKQTPPMYSAVRVKGKRLYEYARENIPVERPTREVIIHKIVQTDFMNTSSKDTFQIRVQCSKGTYIRTLCVDIGEALGYPAHMSFLIRTISDGFKLEETVTFEDVQNAIDQDIFSTLLQPVERCVESLDGIQVNEADRIKVLQGQKLPLPNKIPETRPFKMMYQNQLLAMYDLHPDKKSELKPVRVFNIHKS
ncbi:MAG TPA: tRNA pseudouridine(55) synthase TruB [Pseudogracilibacillus sp.]|nr:tRNA pseudouridine(55) synthase TruB [Pseudogracilibacillus sp.]